MAEEKKEAYEFSIAGFKLKLNSAVLAMAIPIATTVGGAMWGAFEFYKDYTDMKVKIQKYVAPDLSAFDKRLAVIGGGNSAVQEAIFLTSYASHIDLLVRGDSFRASEVLQHELKKHREKITIHLNTTTDEIVAVDNKVHHVLSTRKTTGKKIEYPVDGVFVFVGLEPNTQFLKGSDVELDAIKLIKTNDHLETSVKGVFAAGDVRSGATMQIASATGEGATAALEIREYLDNLKR